MTPQEARAEFEGQLAALELVAMYLGQTVSLLRRCVEGEISLLGKKDNDLMHIAFTHYIVNNLFALFDDGSRDVNSLTRVAKRFKSHFPHNFFSEYLTSVEKFRTRHAVDLERIGKNRNLSTAHLGASKKEQLGWPPHIAKNIDQILGTQSSVAQNDSLRFITPLSIFEMPVMRDILEIESILEELRFKTIGVRNSE